MKQLSRLINILLLCGPLLAGAMTEEYGGPFAATAWISSSDPLMCRLSQVIPNYGEASFIRPAGGRIEFTIRIWSGSLETGEASLKVTPTPWQHSKTSKDLGLLMINEGPVPFTLSDKQALRLMNYLSGGWQTTIQYADVSGEDVVINLSPVNFRTPYQEFLQCGGKLLPFTPMSVQWIVLLFEEESTSITPTMKEKLDRIRTFVRRGVKFNRLVIKGYSDNYGEEEKNMRISVNRALAVKTYLVTNGIPVEKIEMSAYGSHYPVASNDTERGRAKNRRVSVELIRN